MVTETFGTCETVTDFLDWAIEEHAHYTAGQIGINRDGITELLHWADNASADEDSLDIALPLFRYYLQAAKTRFNYTDEQLAELTIINKPRIKIANLNDLMAKVTPAPAIHNATTLHTRTKVLTHESRRRNCHRTATLPQHEQRHAHCQSSKHHARRRLQ
jgi:hypothetical protein